MASTKRVMKEQQSSGCCRPHANTTEALPSRHLFITQWQTLDWRNNSAVMRKFNIQWWKLRVLAERLCPGFRGKVLTFFPQQKKSLCPEINYGKQEGRKNRGVLSQNYIEAGRNGEERKTFIFWGNKRDQSLNCNSRLSQDSPFIG